MSNDSELSKASTEKYPIWSYLALGFLGVFAARQSLRIKNRFHQLNRFHEATTQANRQKERVRNAQEEYRRTQIRKQREKKVKEEAEEEMRHEARYRHMKEEEERERDRYRRAYARWLRQSEFHQQQEQQHQYWDGQSFGHGWTEEEEKRRSQRGREGSEGWRMGWNRNEPHYQHLHLNTLGLVRQAGKTYSQEEIKAAFRAKAMEFHPDRNPSNSKEAANNFKKALEAYQALSVKNDVKNR